MEMPISVIITLFVAVVVAGVIILFSRTTIIQAGTTLRGMDAKSQIGFEERIIIVDTLTKSKAQELVGQCVNDIKSAEQRKLCYVVRAKSFDPTISSLSSQTVTQAGRKFTINAPTSLSGDNAIFIYFNPIGSIDLET